ncbi:hypothetical protein EDB81DRAFT_794946 [Dactylonectria macrodidyma]|uniref:Ankyrin repeat domain-containing protein n=1 Tax=Dactylonectria macrodidyma TaxID=307937 RepID=A0A9P9J8K8_9HYPO|nr:hypothetical protein EDB81DRAFT_794946 [Dactylonectria macrodidyma]
MGDGCRFLSCFLLTLLATTRIHRFICLLHVICRLHAMSYPQERLDAIRNDIARVEEARRGRHHLERRVPPEKARERLERNCSQHVQGRPDLPPRMERPEYAKAGGLIGQDDMEIGFYAACEDGLLAPVKSFVKDCNPSQAVRQYGLEVASFAIQPVVVRHLLEQDTWLHDGVFLRSCFSPGGKVVSLFDKDRGDPLPVVRVFLDFGWHPNQLWNVLSPLTPAWGKRPLLDSITNKPLLTLLLSHGADPHLSRQIVGIFDKIPVSRDCGTLLNNAARIGDPELIALLLEHGADMRLSSPLHSMAAWQGGAMPGWPCQPFSARRPAAEYLVSNHLVGINDIKNIAFPDEISSPARRREDATPFTIACTAQDWEFAEWLLEHGADPNLLNGRAFEPLTYSEPRLGPTDPAVVRELVEKVRKRKESEEAAEGS